jgi:plastocyanin
MRVIFWSVAVTAVLLLAPVGAARADDPIVITIKNHKFTPDELKISAGKRVVLTVVNDDRTPEEFESKPMKVEKVIPGKSKATVRIGPLEKGRYSFIGEFNEATAKGVVIAE